MGKHFPSLMKKACGNPSNAWKTDRSKLFRCLYIPKLKNWESASTEWGALRTLRLIPLHPTRIIMITEAATRYDSAVVRNSLQACLVAFLNHGRRLGITASSTVNVMLFYPILSCSMYCVVNSVFRGRAAMTPNVLYFSISRGCPP